METFHKRMSYVGMVGIVLMSLAVIRYFFYGDSQIEGTIFALGFLGIITPSAIYQITIPAGLEEIPVWIIIMFYCFFIPINAIMVLCVRIITSNQINYGFPWVDVLGILVTMTLIGLIVRAIKNR